MYTVEYKIQRWAAEKFNGIVNIFYFYDIGPVYIIIFICKIYIIYTIVVFPDETGLLMFWWFLKLLYIFNLMAFQIYNMYLYIIYKTEI